MAVTGYNPSIVNKAINNIDNAYLAVMKALVETNQNVFIAPMGVVWGSPQAQKFFQKYQEAITQMSTEVTKVFKSVVDAMNDAANNLALIAGAQWSIVEMTSYSKTIDISCIKEALADGTIGIDQTQANSTAAQLFDISSAINSSMNDAINAVSSSGFVGGEMQSSLLRSLGNINISIGNEISMLKSEVSQAIQETADMYTTTSTNISSAFSGGN